MADTTKLKLQQSYVHKGVIYNPDPEGGRVEVPNTLAEFIKGKGAGDVLPPGFPAKAILKRGGYDTLSAVEAASDEDLTKLSGIGDDTLAKIRSYDPDEAA